MLRVIAPYVSLAGIVALAYQGHRVTVLTNENQTLKSALAAANQYIETTKEITDATIDLPDDPDDVLRELCRLFPRGSGCGDT